MDAAGLKQAVSKDRERIVESLCSMIRIKAIGPENNGEGEAERGRFLAALAKQMGFRSIRSPRVCRPPGSGRKEAEHHHPGEGHDGPQPLGSHSHGDYLRVLHKHRLLVTFIFLGTLGVAAFRVYSEIPLFTAGTTVLIERQTPQVLNIQDATTIAPYWDEYDYYKTQYEILRSRSLAAHVMRENGLTNFGGSPIKNRSP